MRLYTPLPRPLVAVAAILLATVSAIPDSPNFHRQPGETCTVAFVIDGDTLECRGGPRVRLIGIDAPEMDQEPYGWAARAALDSLARRGAQLRMVVGVERFDSRGRTLGYLYAPDGTFINLAMVRRGYAVDLAIRPNVEHAAALRAAAAAARSSGAGLWRAGGFDCLPARRRRNLC